MAPQKTKVMTYIDSDLREELERLAEIRNRSLSNLLETLIQAEIKQAKITGELSQVRY